MTTAGANVKIYYLSAVLAAVYASGVSAQEAAPLSDADAVQRFIGVWSLVHWEETLADGSTREHQVTAGRIIYSDIGEMCAVVMDPNRPHWQSATPTAQEALEGMNSRVFYAYCATTEMHAADGYFTQRAVIDKTPNMVGARRKRWFRFLGPDRVELRIDPSELREPVVESALIWERVVE